MRTAPIGPSKGMPESISAADGGVDGQHVVGVLLVGAEDGDRRPGSRCGSPSANDGRSGRSISRQVRMAVSVGRPSRRKNEPGILPAAYIRSSTSTVRGKKSIPSRTPLAALAVARTMVSPIAATTAPCDCWASLPVSNDEGLVGPADGPRHGMASAMVWHPSSDAPFGRSACGAGRLGAAGQFPVGDPLRRARGGPGDRRLTTDRDAAR